MNQPDELIANQERRPKTKDIDVVNLNTATVEELSRLPGIAAKLAGRIIDYRTKVHPFRETAEITQVRGISAALYAGIADLLTVGSVEPVSRVEREEAALPAEPEAPALRVEPEPPALTVEPESPALIVESEVLAPVVEPEAPEVVARELPPVPPPSAPPALRQTAPHHTTVRESPQSRPQPAPEPTRGAGWPALLAVCLVSAIAGACLALLLLQVINGTLKFGPGATVSELETRARQLDGQAGELVADLSQMQGRLDEVDSRLAAAQAELRAVNQEITRVGGDVETFQGRLRAVEAQLGGLAEDLQAVRQAARRFDAFLSGLRELLDQSQAPAPAVTPLPQAPSPTRKPGLTVVPQPTSTPKP